MAIAPSAMTAADILAAGGAAKVTASPRLLNAGNRVQLLDTAAGGGGSNNSGANYTRGESIQRWQNGPVAIRNLVLVFGNYALGPYENAVAAGNAITVEAVIASTGAPGENIARVSFGGRTTVTIDPDGEVQSDPIGFYVAPNATISVRVGVTVASGQTWPTGYLSSFPTDSSVASTSATSQIAVNSSSFSVPSGGAASQPGYGPTALLAEFDAPALSVALLGDSLTQGLTGATFGDGAGNRGVLGYGLAQAGVLNYSRLARASEAAFNFQSVGRVKHRMKLATYATHVVVWLGTNDVPLRTAAQIQAYLTGIYQQLRGRVQRIIAVTLPPRTTGTFTTTAGQTPSAGYEVGGVRDQVNTWIKAQIGGLIDEVIDLNSIFESPTTPGVWVPNLTGDGTHPNEAGMQAGKGLVAAASSAWTVK